ncbi:RsfA family transcriptional regulator [Bacillus fonticola]|uniref:RsfA family transcriptional regulator n=1 Tax=Bacillus fonticola TaxID=2728853 RepID=UPI00147387A2|nr:RsfA family transcriptional regulator [Bacillus fonticola]
MTNTRQDAWTNEEDDCLAEIVLEHIENGGTQLQAFEEVGKRLSRTPAACGFRWNSYLRKQYQDGIEQAKKMRKERKKVSFGEIAQKKAEAKVTEEKESEIRPAIQHCMDALQQLTTQLHHYELPSSQYEGLKKENEQLKREKMALTQQVEQLQGILERARALVVSSVPYHRG